MTIERPLWRRWLLPVCLVLAVVNLIGFAAWTGPRGVRQNQAAARTEQARAELVRLRELTGRLRERAEAMRANAEDRDRFYGRAGSEQTELVSVHEAVQAMVRSAGLQPGDRRVNHDDLEGTPLERVTFNLPLSGSYDQLVRFLGEVERSPRFLVVDRISMSGEPGSAKLQVDVSTFMKSPSLAEGGGERARGR